MAAKNMPSQRTSAGRPRPVRAAAPAKQGGAKATVKQAVRPAVKATPKPASRTAVKAVAKPAARSVVKAVVKPPAKPSRSAVPAKATSRVAKSAKPVKPVKAAVKPSKPVKPLKVAKPVKPIKTTMQVKAPAKVERAVKPLPAPPQKTPAPPKPAKVKAVKTEVQPPVPPVRKAPAVSLPKMLSREFLAELATHIRDAVSPNVRAAKGREIVGSASSGDATFQLDAIAEKALINFLKDVKEPIAYYSEDAGYTTFASGPPQHLLVVDPIDGTRAAMHGFEGCVVSVASTRVIERPALGDIDNALVMEIVGNRTFYAERGKGTKIYQEDQVKKPRLSTNTDLERMSWAMTVPARPAELIFPTAAKLIDLTSLKGGFFTCNSTSFSLTRLVTGQIDASVDFANRYLRDIREAVEDQFINAGRGVILGIAPYDIAASVLIAEEAGATVTDAFGNRFDDVPLLDSSVQNHRSLIATSNKELHKKLMSFFEIRINQFEQLLKRRAQQFS